MRSYSLEKIPFQGSPFDAYRRLKRSSAAVLLESARRSGKSGRWSVVCADPVSELRLERGGRDPFEALKKTLGKPVPAPEGFPPFLGGAVGYFSYECKNRVEPGLGRLATDDLGLPEAYFLFFDSGVL